MNVLDVFNGQVPFRRTYLQPTASRKNVPKGLKDLDEYSEEQKVQKSHRSEIRKSQCRV